LRTRACVTDLRAVGEHDPGRDSAAVYERLCQAHQTAAGHDRFDVGAAGLAEVQDGPTSLEVPGGTAAMETRRPPAF